MKQIDDITWQSNDGLITFKNMDCNEFMAGCKENEFDLNLSDPPYGFNNGNIPNNAAKQEIYKKYKEQIWDIKPDTFSFDEIFRTSLNQIIWGGNYFSELWTRGNNRGYIFWDKIQVSNKHADGELAWTSFDKNCKLFRYCWSGNRYGFEEELKGVGMPSERIHPTEKPIELYKWIIDNYTKPTDTILDCFGGSMSHAIAAHMKRRKLTIIELDSEYFASALFRFSEYEQKVEDIKEFGYAKTKINAQNPVLF